MFIPRLWFFEANPCVLCPVRRELDEKRGELENEIKRIDAIIQFLSKLKKSQNPLIQKIIQRKIDTRGDR
jgi:hypothetical protein